MIRSALKYPNGEHYAITTDNSPKSKALNNFSNTAQYCDIESD